MVTSADWIRVGLTPADHALAWEIAHLKHTEAVRRGFRARGFGTIGTHLIGARGEIAAGHYLGYEVKPETYAQERARGGDFPDRWEARCRSARHYGLPLQQGDEGKRFILALDHDNRDSIVWLAGWIEADDGFKLAVQRRDGEGENNHQWGWVPQKHLKPLLPRNGYSSLAYFYAQLDWPARCAPCGKQFRAVTDWLAHTQPDSHGRPCCPVQLRIEEG